MPSGVASCKNLKPAGAGPAQGGNTFIRQNSPVAKITASDMK